MSLSSRQIEAYSRQIILREFSGASQEKLLASCVQIEGYGLAAQTAATYLAGAGIGTLHVAPEISEPGIFAPLAERSEDTRIELAAPTQSPDVLILTTPSPAPNRARLGVVIIEQNPLGETHLTRLPAAGFALACPACVPREENGATIDPAGAAIAGSLAALTAIRWITERSADELPSRQTLRQGGSTFSDNQLEPIRPCNGPLPAAIS